MARGEASLACHACACDRRIASPPPPARFALLLPSAAARRCCSFASRLFRAAGAHKVGVSKEHEANTTHILDRHVAIWILGRGGHDEKEEHRCQPYCCRRCIIGPVLLWSGESKRGFRCGSFACCPSRSTETRLFSDLRSLNDRRESTSSHNSLHFMYATSAIIAAVARHIVPGQKQVPARCRCHQCVNEERSIAAEAPTYVWKQRAGTRRTN